MNQLSVFASSPTVTPHEGPPSHAILPPANPVGSEDDAGSPAEAPASPAGVAQGDQPSDQVVYRTLYVNTRTGTAHIYKECDYLKHLWPQGRVREAFFEVKPGSKAKLRYCSQCVADLLFEASERYI